ncbi:hypothetical protein OZD63_05720, partial [Wolbachia endosymbiont of Drosophila leontia]|uniref:hypothetical protein n=1 Tax=Wolbachia endosymbiont of Drosophila leontia TaxID=3002580 RepID=UPI0023A9CFA0
DSFHMEKNQCLQCCCRGRYDGSRQHDDGLYLVIPLLVSGIYVKRYRGGMTIRHKPNGKNCERQ